jgi:hypothetical protein
VVDPDTVIDTGTVYVPAGVLAAPPEPQPVIPQRPAEAVRTKTKISDPVQNRCRAASLRRRFLKLRGSKSRAEEISGTYVFPGPLVKPAEVVALVEKVSVEV